MRKFFDLIIQFFRRNFGPSLYFSLLIPLGMIAISFLGGGGNVKPKTVICNLDQGSYAGAFIANYPQEESIQIVDTIKEGERLIQEQVKDNFYIFSENYSATIANGEVPELLRKTRDKSVLDDQGFLTYLQNQVHNAVIQVVAENAGVHYTPVDKKLDLLKFGNEITGEQQLLIMTMGFSILYGSAYLGKDLVAMKKNKVLRRGLTTPTTGMVVLASNIAGSWFLQFLTFLLCVALVSFIIPFSAQFLAIFIVMLAMLCLFSVCFQLLMLRLFKEPNIASFVGMMSAMLFIFLAMLKDLQEVIRNLPSVIFNLGYLSPFYWIIEAVEGRSLLLSVGMMLLLSMTLFFAGSFHLKDFAD